MSAARKETPRKRAGGGQIRCETHCIAAPAGEITDQMYPDTQHRSVRVGAARKGRAKKFAGHGNADTPKIVASDGIGHDTTDTHWSVVDPDPSADHSSRATLREAVSSDGSLRTAVDLIVIRHREYRGLQQARGDMERRIKADARSQATRRMRLAGETIDPVKMPVPTDDDFRLVEVTKPRYFTALNQLKKLERECLADLLEPTKSLPVVAWQEAQHGFGIASLAAIIGHAGNLADYANPAKLWKRFSLHVVDGSAARRIKSDDSQEFVPRRRAEMHVIGDTLLRAGGEYASLYRERKQFEIEKAELLGLEVCPAARIPKNNAALFISDGLIHKRSLRYIEKRLLRDLWRAWREASTRAVPIENLPPADLSEAA